jgi:hypothetical protein
MNLSAAEVHEKLVGKSLTKGVTLDIIPIYVYLL